MQLLVDHRETLKVGDIVPVGDLLTSSPTGTRLFSQEMAIHFDNAKRIYHQKLLPVPRNSMAGVTIWRICVMTIPNAPPSETMTGW